MSHLSEPGRSRKVSWNMSCMRKKLTMGVNHRIMDLADRENGFVRKNARPFESIVPLPEVISACVGRL